MSMSLRLLVLGLVLLAQQPCADLYAQQTESTSRFVRFVAGGDVWQGELQTAISSYRNDAGVLLDLVATVHIADQAYYAELNDYFSTRDAVLYELVADANVRPSPDSQVSNSSVLGFVQRSLASFLDVSFQLEQIDYSPANFRHADLNPAQLRQIMQDKNENFFSMFISLALAQLATQQSQNGNSATTSSFNLLALVSALIAEDQTSAFKYLFAKELGRSDGMIVGPVLEQQLTILGDRNRAALDVLVDSLNNPNEQKLSIFYGAAHMPGIEREIIRSLGFQKRQQRWLTAWEIP